MFKKRYAKPGTAPATLTPIAPGLGVHQPEIRLVEYNVEHLRERDVALVAELPQPVDDETVRWIEINGLGDVDVIRAVGEKYHLHPLALEDVVHVGQRPKVETYDGHIFIVAQMIYYDDDGRFTSEQVSMFLSKNLLITFQEDPKKDVFDPVRERLRGGRGYIRKLKSDYLAYALLDSVIDHCFPVLEKLGESVEELENELLDQPTHSCVQRLHDMRRVLMHLRRLAWPERDIVSGLLHDESGLVTDQTKVFLRDCYDHAVQIMDLIESYRDVTSGMLDMYLSSVSLRTNETMRVLTVITSIFIPLTFIAGVYGMNFAPASPTGQPLGLNMPELYHPYGYAGCLLVMLAIAAAQLVYFKKRGWL